LFAAADEAAGRWLVSVTESTEAGLPLAMTEGLLACVTGVGVFDVAVWGWEGVDVDGVGVRAVAGVLAPVELWAWGDTADWLAGPGVDVAADGLG